MKKLYTHYKEGFSFGFAKTIQHAWFIFLTIIILSLLFSVASDSPLLITLLYPLAGVGIASVALAIARGHSFDFSSLVHPSLSPKRVIKFFVLVLLMLIPVACVLLATKLLFIGTIAGNPSLVTLGAVFLFVSLPSAVYVLVRYKFIPFVVVEHEHASFSELVTTSAKVTNGHFWEVFGFLFILLTGICIVSFTGNNLYFRGYDILSHVVYLLGFSIIIPTGIFTFAHLYNRLKSHS